MYIRIYNQLSTQFNMFLPHAQYLLSMNMALHEPLELQNSHDILQSYVVAMLMDVVFEMISNVHIRQGNK